MPRRAKTITDEQLAGLLRRVAVESRKPLRDYVVILLSFKAGLRVGEISGLQWTDVLEADRTLSNTIRVPKQVAKKGSYREIPMHPALAAALENLARLEFPDKTPTGYIVRGLYWDAPISANTLQKYLARLYREHGLDCTSHSGRRTLLTRMARTANTYGCTIFDVQRIAGHSNVTTTEAYIEPSDSVRKLVEKS